MSILSKSAKKYSAALYFKGKSVPQIVAEAQGIVQGMTGNTWFPSPPMPLPTVSTAISNVASAQVVAQTKARGAAATMHAFVKVLEGMCKQLATYVCSVANANPNSGDAILSSANMTQRKAPIVVKKGYRVHATRNFGELFIMTVRVLKATYNFEMTTDPTGATGWASIYTGTKCKFVKTGLVSGTRYFVRVIVTGVNGVEPPSLVLSAVAL
jgi:hypothetical protein